MVGRIPHYTALVLLFSLFLMHRAEAQVPSQEPDGRPPASEASGEEDKRKAEKLFDRAVHNFVNGRHEEAARLFLEADSAWPNREALRNGIAAAQKSKNLLLTAQAAQRALARRDVDARTVKAAHQALAVVTPKLARLDLECAEETCHIQVDGVPQKRGVTYVLPGGHEVVGTTGRDTQIVHHVDCPAGAICQVTLRPSDADTVAAAPLPSSPTTAQAEPATPVSTPSPVREVATERDAPAPRLLRAPKWAPLSALVVSSAGTALFAGLTTWSGLDALAARDLHESDPEAYDPDDVRRLTTRTDILLSGAIVFAGATIASTFWWVRWKQHQRASVAFVPGSGVAVVAEGRF